MSFISSCRRSFFLLPLCAQLLYAAAPQVHQVAQPPELVPLALYIGGRVISKPLNPAGAFGGYELVSQWPGTYFRASFRGSHVFFRVEKSQEILHLTIDGHPLGPLIKPVAGVYEIDNLTDTPHALSISVATESQDSPNDFGGIAIPRGEQAMPPPHHARQIEFIGDSHTVGYGNLSAKHECTKDEIWANTDNTSAFGAITAAHYGADYRVLAISGRGVVRNYNGFTADTLPQAYPFVLLDHDHRDTDSSWKPQVVVIALGTNDFSTPLNADERWKTRSELHEDFESTYVRFLRQLREQNPTSYFIVWATNVAGGEVEVEAKRVVEDVQNHGDGRIAFIPIDNLSFGACDSHPSLADEKLISQKLIQHIDTDQQIWQSK